MCTRSLSLMLGVAMLFAVGCTSQQRPVNVLLDNQSTASLEVEVDLPARGPLGRKPNHEAFRMLLPAGKTWRNAPDTLRFAAEPNEAKGFRIWVADIGQTPKLWYHAFTITGSRKNCHVIFTGEPGSLSWMEPGGRSQRLEVWSQ